MRAFCPNSGCDAVYNLNPQHVGKQFNCRKCGTALAVESDGLRIVTQAGPPEMPAVPTPAATPSSPPEMPPVTAERAPADADEASSAPAATHSEPAPAQPAQAQPTPTESHVHVAAAAQETEFSDAAQPSSPAIEQFAAGPQAYQREIPRPVSAPVSRPAVPPGTTAPVATAAAAPTAQAVSDQRSSGTACAWNCLRNDPASWGFAFGSVLVILFLFFPILDQLKLAKFKAAVEIGDQEQTRLDRELQAKEQANPSRAGADIDRKSRREAREKWTRQRSEVEAQAEQHRIGLRGSAYWYTWGMLLGFLALAASAVGFLSPAQPMTRRVVGAIVLCAQLLLIFITYVMGSASLTIFRAAM
jgi:hypothetical protein